jgi:predicted RNA binding protein YcfA (HicA-like mRNA interferase family)
MLMSRSSKTLERVLRGTSDANISFADLCSLLGSLGFVERIKGSHHIFTHDDVEEILNLQPKKGKAKAYQVAQVRDVIITYGFGGEPEGDDEGA